MGSFSARHVCAEDASAGESEKKEVEKKDEPPQDQLIWIPLLWAVNHPTVSFMAAFKQPGPP